MTNPVYLTRAGFEDLPAVSALEALCFPHPWTYRQFVGLLRSNDAWLYLLRNPKCDVVGYCGLQRVVGEAHIHTLAIHPDYRRQSLGRCLISITLDILRARGTRHVFLEVRAGNHPALGLYRSLGFRQVGRRPQYYKHPQEDAEILRLDL